MLKFEGGWNEFLFYRQLWTKYLAKSKKKKRSWTRQQNFNICFGLIFDRHHQKFVCAQETEY